MPFGSVCTLVITLFIVSSPYESGWFVYELLAARQGVAPCLVGHLAWRPRGHKLCSLLFLVIPPAIQALRVQLAPVQNRTLAPTPSHLAPRRLILVSSLAEIALPVERMTVTLKLVVPIRAVHSSPFQSPFMYYFPDSSNQLIRLPARVFILPD
jgi:hypothetical protein